MNPEITSKTPAKDEMGMDYVPVYEDETKGGGGANSPEGYATVQVGAERIRLAGIQSAPATRETISRPVRAAGVVVADETRVRRVQAKIDGWVEKLHTNFTGQLVTKGQPLLEIYSPELVATQREYLLARAGVDRMKESPYEDARQMSSGLAQAARTRLKLFDVPESFIEELERTGKVRRTVTLNAPVSGYVTGKEVFEGTRVEPGMDLLTVTDLSRVWIEADVYEYEAQSVRVGQTATLETVADPGAKLKGRVSFVYPTFSPETRTLKVRFEFPNPGLRLKPRMYVNVSLDLQRRDRRGHPRLGADRHRRPPDRVRGRGRRLLRAARGEGGRPRRRQGADPVRREGGGERRRGRQLPARLRVAAARGAREDDRGRRNEPARRGVARRAREDPSSSASSSSARSTGT